MKNVLAVLTVIILSFVLAVLIMMIPVSLVGLLCNWLFPIIGFVNFHFNLTFWTVASVASIVVILKSIFRI